jgi:hypothetical protein
MPILLLLFVAVAVLNRQFADKAFLGQDKLIQSRLP